MIIGIGTDLIEVARLQDMLERRGDALARRVLTEAELAGFHRHAVPARFLAKRFAAKEATLKALGTGLRNGIRWLDVAVQHDELGKPSILLSGAALERFRTLGATGIHLSISDERNYAVAFVILDRS